MKKGNEWAWLLTIIGTIAFALTLAAIGSATKG